MRLFVFFSLFLLKESSSSKLCVHFADTNAWLTLAVMEPRVRSSLSGCTGGFIISNASTFRIVIKYARVTGKRHHQSDGYCTPAINIEVEQLQMTNSVETSATYLNGFPARLMPC